MHKKTRSDPADIDDPYKMYHMEKKMIDKYEKLLKEGQHHEEEDKK